MNANSNNNRRLVRVRPRRAAQQPQQAAIASLLQSVPRPVPVRVQRQVRRRGGPALGPGPGPAMSRLSSVPQAVSRVRTQSAPSVAMAGNGERCVVRHREYVAEVAGLTAFTVTRYVCQPGLQTLFVWLAKIAGNFEKYRFRRLRFIYETEAPSTQAGTVIFSFDFDPLDAAPGSKQEVMSNRCCARAAPWQEFALDVPISDMQRDWFFIRSGSVPSGADQKLYDAGNFLVCTQNASGAAGEIYVEYEIELISPQANTSPISGRINGTTGLTAATLFGSDAAYASGSNIGWDITSSGQLTCTVAGTYLFAVSLTGTTIVAASIIESGTCTLVSQDCTMPTAATKAVGWCVITAQVGETFIPSITSAATLTAAAWRCSQYNVLLG